MRTKIVAGNWKMNTLIDEGVSLLKELNINLSYNKTNAKIVVAVPSTHLNKCVESVDPEIITISAQNCSQFDAGAYTGEISTAMIKNIGAEFVLVGHSERRQVFGEQNDTLAQKVSKCHISNLIPILCCGETLEERLEGQYFNLIKTQLTVALRDVNDIDILKTVIAYEPIWAIGTGQTASPQQAQEVHKYIREVLANLYSDEIAEQISILYGGSVKPNNAQELFAQDDIDGGLVGGASLVVKDFLQIIKSI